MKESDVFGGLGKIVEQAVKSALDANAVRSDITLAEAVKLIGLVEQLADSQGQRVVIAVYSRAARPVAVHCMDEAYIASYDIAVNKAYTSAALKMPTSELKLLSQPGAALYGIQNTNDGKIVVFGGGEPLIHKGVIIGALGVSGSDEETDTRLAAYGREKLKEVMTW